MRYAKFVAAAVGAIATSVVTVFGADTTLGRVATVVLAGLTAVAVYIVPNVEPPVPAPTRES